MDAGEKAERWTQAIAALVLLVLLVAVITRYLATQRPVARSVRPAESAAVVPLLPAPEVSERQRQDEIWRRAVAEGAAVWDHDVPLDQDALELLALERFPQDQAARALWLDGVLWGYVTGGRQAE